MANEYSMKLLALATQMGWYKRPEWSFGGGRLPVLLEGAPGTAKTQAIKNVVGPVLHERLEEIASGSQASYLREEYAGKFFVGTLVVPQTSPETIEGIPVPDFDKRELSRLPLDVIKEAKRATYGILFFDEITSGSEATGASVMTTVQDGVAGSERLPDTFAVHLACNPADQAAAGRDLSLPEINRVMKLEWALPHTAFLDFLNGGSGLARDVAFLDPDWEEKNIIRASVIISTFLRANAKQQNTVTSGTHKGDGPWASERSWVNTIRMLAAVLSLGEEANSGLFYEASRGLVGSSADALVEFLRDMDLPDPEELLTEALKPDGKPLDLIPTSVNRPDKRKIMLESVARCATRSGHEQARERWQAAWKILGPFLDTHPDEAQEGMNILTSATPAGATIPDAAAKLFKVRRAAGLIKY